MNISRQTLFCMLAILSMAAALGCVKKPTSTAEVPRHLSKTYKVAVAPFTQPLEPGQLLTGQIPEEQGKAPQDVLLSLDIDLRDALTSSTSREYDFIPRKNLHSELNVAHSTAQASALARWVAYGKKYGANYLLVPQVLNWHEREGSQAGVTHSAHCRVEFFLLNIDYGLIAERSVFEEKQQGLADNLLEFGNFIKRKGQWITARELAIEGMKAAIREMGL